MASIMGPARQNEQIITSTVTRCRFFKRSRHGDEVANTIEIGIGTVQKQLELRKSKDCDVQVQEC